MKRILRSSAILLAALLCACGGSDRYMGAWKAVDAEGMKADVVFEQNRFEIKREDGKTAVFQFTQNFYEYDNGRVIYGIDVKGGSDLYLRFPFQNNDGRGAITTGDSVVLMTLDRDNYVPVSRFYELPE